MFRKIILAALLLFVATALLVPPVYAQEATGKIVGVITDPAGAVIAGAKVTVTNAATNIATETTTDKEGNYQVLHLPIGNYVVAAEHTGFRRSTTVPHELEINQSLRVDVPLQVGTAAETVEVSSEASLVESYNPTIGDSVTARPIINMPLNGRNVLDLARLEPGVTESNPGNSSAGTFSIAGGRTDSVTFLLDGGMNNNLLNNGVVYNPNPDTVAEFRILQSDYNAEYGRNNGGIISVVTKSGTNSFHGSAYDYIRNDWLDANSFFNKRPLPGEPVTPRDILKRHQFGGTIGGPVKKDKLFFFFGYQGQRQTQSSSPGVQTVFTTRELNGDFSQSGGNTQLVADFLAAHPYYQANPALAAQGIIDPTKIDPVAQRYIKAGLVPATDSGLVRLTGKSTDNNNEYTAKVDYQLTQNDRLTGTIGMFRRTTYDPFGGSNQSLEFPDNTYRKNYYANIAYTKTITANLLNEFRFTAQRANQSQYIPAKKQPNYKDLGINIASDDPTGPPIVYFYDSGMNLGFWYQGPAWLINNTFSFTDTLSWVKGKHNLKFGFMYSPYQNNTVYDYLQNGEFDFYGANTYYASGAEFADFLFGMPDEFYEYGRAPSNIRSKSYYGFAQDEWKVTKNLVLSLGLRYEYSSPKKDLQGRSFSIVPGMQSTRFVNAPPGLLFPGDKGAPTGSNFPDRNDFAPRFGFAWDPFSNGKTSVRGGFGVFYDILKGEDNLQFNGQAPFFGYSDFYPSDYDIAYTFSDAAPFFSNPYGSLGITNPFPSQPPAQNIDFAASGFLPFGGSSVYFVNPKLRTPYTYQYNFSIQQELAPSLRFDMAYVGSTSRKLTALVDTNPIVLGTKNRLLNLQPGALNTSPYSWTNTKTFMNVGNASYNSFQTSLKKQLSGEGTKWGGTYFTLGYTWAKNMDNSSGFRNNTSRVPYYNPGLFRSLADTDIQHRVTFGGGWDLPFYELVGGPKRLTKGWSLYPIITLRGGFPLDIYAPLSQKIAIPGPSGAGDSYLVRVNQVGSTVSVTNPTNAKTDSSTMGLIYFDGTPGAQFEWASLSALNKTNLIPTDAQRTYGTYRRNSLRGPGRRNLDLSISKNTAITERMNLEIRADMFNAFNNPQFNNPVLNPTDPNGLFGEIRSTAAPRIIQIAARFTF